METKTQTSNDMKTTEQMQIIGTKQKSNDRDKDGRFYIQKKMDGNSEQWRFHPSMKNHEENHVSLTKKDYTKWNHFTINRKEDREKGIMKNRNKLQCIVF